MHISAAIYIAALTTTFLGCGDGNASTLADEVRNHDYERLTARVHSDDESIRCAAAIALSGVRHPKAADTQIALLGERRCGWKVPVESAWRLSELGHAEAFTAINELLTADDRRIRWNAAVIIATWQPAKETKLLRDCMQNDEDKLVREWCAWASCRISATNAGQKSDCQRPVMELFRRDQTAASKVQ